MLFICRNFLARVARRTRLTLWERLDVDDVLPPTTLFIRVHSCGHNHYSHYYRVVCFQGMFPRGFHVHVGDHRKNVPYQAESPSDGVHPSWSLTLPPHTLRIISSCTHVGRPSRGSI